MLLDILKEHIVPGMIGPGETNSLIKEWLGIRQLSQSQVIRFGILFEEALNECVAASPLLSAITTAERKTYITASGQLTPTPKGNKDIDLLFQHGNTIFYRESKCSLRLDSEKSKETVAKIGEIVNRLQVAFPDHHIDAAILNMEWENPRQSYLGTRVEYMKTFFARLGLGKITEQDYTNYGNLIGKEILNYAAHN